MLLTSVGESIFQLIVVLAIFVGVLALTYYVTKWLAGYQKAQQFNKNLEIVETIKLTTNKYVQIVRAGEDHFYVVALGKDEVTLLGSLTTDDLKEYTENEPEEYNPLQNLDFKSILEKVSKKNKQLKNML